MPSRNDNVSSTVASGEELLEISRRIEAIASRAAEEIEALFFTYAKELRERAAPDDSSDSEETPG